ncbi:hypothetical protein [Herbaspirillum huttiense]|jgi:hypothetical protein|uniref:hypothetical protein n=1 Tax=Herbaspirillum huttiense TaxID=863372 RepID=UPI0031DD5E97
MNFLPETLENLARLGANIEIGPNSGYLPETLEKIVRLASSREAHVVISAQGLLPETLEKLARIGRKNLTIKF